MRRREFITLLCGTAIWPVVARAQQGDRPRRVGVLLAYLESDAQVQTWTKALETSLQELGWTSGHNIQLDYRWAGPNPDRLRAAAEELVRLSPDILVPVATPALIAAQHATGSIPIVFANVGRLARVSSQALLGQEETSQDSVCSIFRWQENGCRQSRRLRRR